MLLADIFPEIKYQADNLSHELEGMVSLENGIRDQRDAEKGEAEGLASEQPGSIGCWKRKKAKAAQGERSWLVKQAAPTRRTRDRLNELIDRLVPRSPRSRSPIRRRDRRRAGAQGARAAAGSGHPGQRERGRDQAGIDQRRFASPDRLKPAMPFEAAKGSLRLPAQGKRIKRFGAADATGGTLREFVANPRRSRITAPADGWVVYAGEFRSLRANS